MKALILCGCLGLMAVVGARVRADIPTAEQTVDLFGFNPKVTLEMETPRVANLFGFGKPTWYRSYQNRDATHFAIMIASYKSGPKLDAKQKKDLDEQIKRGGFSVWPFSKRNPNFAFKTKDGRAGYNILGGSLGGPIEFTILPSAKNKPGLLILMMYNKEDGVELGEQMKKGPMPARTGFDVMEKVEVIVSSPPPAVKP